MLTIRNVSATIALTVVATAVSASTPAQFATRPLVLRDLFRIQQVGSPELSPDGSLVAFVRTRIEPEADRTRREIWLAPSEGMLAPRRLTNPAWDASDPVWSPDGSLLAFSSNRNDGDEPGGIWFLDMHRGGEAFQIEGVRGTPAFSPDGRWIAFSGRTPATGRAAEASRSRRGRYETLEQFEDEVEQRFTGAIVDWMGYRVDRRGYLPDPRDPATSPARELYLVPRTGGEPRRLTRMAVDTLELAWDPNSARLAFAADETQRDEHTYERHDLWTVDLSGTVTRLTDDGWVNRVPVWSSQGDHIFFQRRQGLDQLIAAGSDQGSPIDLYAIDVGGDAMRNLTASWDLRPRDAFLGPAGRLRFGANIGGQHHLFEVDPSGGSMRQITAGRRWLGGFSVSADGRRMAYTATSVASPGEVYVADASGAAETRVTAFNDTLLAEMVLAPARPLSFTSTDNTTIEGWVMLPAGYRADAGVRYPLILAIHGGPHSAYGESFSLQFQLWAAAGYAVLYTNPRGSTGYGEEFLWATWGGWGNRDSQDLLSGVAHVLENYLLDPRRIGVAGYSYGGFLTNWLITHTDRFRAAISGAGISNWVSDYGTADIPRTKETEFFGPPWELESGALLWEQSPIKHAQGVSTPTLFIHGESDFRVPIEQGEQMYTALRKQQVAARFVRYPDTSHGGWRPWDRAHRYLEELRWWQEHLGDEP